MLADYGENYTNVKLGMRGRIELEYEDDEMKDELIEGLVEESLNKTSIEIYSKIPKASFKKMVEEISSLDSGTIDVESVELPESGELMNFLRSLSNSYDELNSALEITIESLRRCTGLFIKIDTGKYEFSEEKLMRNHD
jgi:magnesium chelatase subunit I